MRNILTIGLGVVIALVGLVAAAKASDNPFYFDGLLFFLFGIVVAFLGIGRAEPGARH
jgi:hypothetical protein